MMNNLFFKYGIPQIISLLGDKKITFNDIMTCCVDRITELNSKLNAFESVDFDLMRDEYSRLESLPHECALPLKGIPMGIKDIFNVDGYKLQMGSPLWKGFTPGNDARVVYSFKEAGGVVAGKTVTAELAVHSLLARTINPFDPARTPGTSSSGSAVAVATGMVPIALATQTAGSITRPASFCGIFGYKPSYGLLPRTGVLKTTDTLDTIGFMAYHAPSLRPVFNSLHVAGCDYPISHAALTDKARQKRTPGNPWKVAFIKTYTWDKAETYVRDSIEKTIQAFDTDKHFEVIEVALPQRLEHCHKLHEKIYSKTLAYYFLKESKQPEKLSSIFQDMIFEGNAITTQEYLLALQQQAKDILWFDEILEAYDIVISIATGSHAPLRNEKELQDPSLIWTYLHLPTICVPQFTSPIGLPFGIQLAARKYNDYLLLDFLDDACAQGLLTSSSQVCPLYGPA